MQLTGPGFETLCVGPFQSVQTRYSPGGPSRTAEEDLWIHEKWRSRGPSREGDTPLFRLSEHRCAKPTLELIVADTSYADYVGTRDPAFRQVFPDSQLADPLAVCVALETPDGQLLLGRRSNVDVGVGWLHVPGGFMDRKLDISAEGTPDPMVAVCREVKEEVGVSVPPEALAALALVYHTETPHPELCFFAHADFSLSDLRLSHGASSHREHSAWIGVPLDPDGLRKFISAEAERLIPSCTATLSILGAERYSSAWLEGLHGVVEAI